MKKKNKNFLFYFIIILMLIGLMFFLIEQSFFGWPTLVDYTNKFKIPTKTIASNSTEAYLDLPKNTNNFSFNVKYWFKNYIANDAVVKVTYEIFNYNTNKYEVIENNEWTLKQSSSAQSHTNFAVHGTSIYGNNIPQRLYAYEYKSKYYKRYFSCLNNQTASYAQQVNPWSEGSSNYEYECVYPGNYIIEYDDYDYNIRHYDISYFPKLLTFDRNYIKEDRAKFRINVTSKTTGNHNLYSRQFNIDLWNINSGNVTYYEFDSSKNLCVKVSKPEYLKNSTIDYLTLEECKNANNLNIVEPIVPLPSGFKLWLSLIVNWIKNLFGVSQTMLGNVIVEPNTIETYEINLSTIVPDSDWTDGTYQVQYANWALLDKSGNIKQEGTWEKIDGTYYKSIKITTPQEINKYVLTAIITQYDMTYDYSTGKWNSSEEKLINKEAINLETKYKIVAPTTPVASGFSKFLNSIINWIKNLFGIN